MTHRRTWLLLIIAMVLGGLHLSTSATHVFAETTGGIAGGVAGGTTGGLMLTQGQTSGGASGGGSVLEFIQAGGIVGLVIILLSFVGAALVIDAFLKIKKDKLLPEDLAEKSIQLARTGQFTELRTCCKADPSMLGSIVGNAIDEGDWGLDAVREHVEQEGSRQLTRLHQRVSYIGLIASIAPMLGLLGTVVGMIRAFEVLGAAKGAARPDELAVGISQALVTTCMGLVVAVPLLFFHALLRDRVTRISQETSAICERLLRAIAVVLTKQQKSQG